MTVQNRELPSIVESWGQQDQCCQRAESEGQVAVARVAVLDPVDQRSEGQQDESPLGGHLQAQEQVRHWPRINEPSTRCQPPTCQEPSR